MFLDQHLELQRYKNGCLVIIPNPYLHLQTHFPPFYSNERQHYYKHRDMAKRSKRDCMSVIIDGMDQAKTNLPHLTRERKCGHGLWRLR